MTNEQKQPGSYAAIMRVRGGELPNVRMTDAPLSIKANATEGNVSDACAIDGSANLDYSGAAVKIDAGPAKYDEATLKMIAFFCGDVLPTYPPKKIEELVEELRSEKFGIFAKEDLVYLQEPGVLEKLSLPPAQRGKLREYLSKL